MMSGVECGIGNKSGLYGPGENTLLIKAIADPVQKNYGMGPVIVVYRIGCMHGYIDDSFVQTGSIGFQILIQNIPADVSTNGRSVAGENRVLECLSVCIDFTNKEQKQQRKYDQQCRMFFKEISQRKQYDKEAVEKEGERILAAVDVVRGNQRTQNEHVYQKCSATNTDRKQMLQQVFLISFLVPGQKKGKKSTGAYDNNDKPEIRIAAEQQILQKIGGFTNPVEQGVRGGRGCSAAAEFKNSADKPEKQYGQMYGISFDIVL